MTFQQIRLFVKYIEHVRWIDFLFALGIRVGILGLNCKFMQLPVLFKEDHQIPKRQKVIQISVVPWDHSALLRYAHLFPADFRQPV